MKVDLDGPVTIREFRAAKTENSARFEGIDWRFEKIEARMETFVTKDMFFSAMKRIDERFEKIEETMYTKADHSKFMEWMDEAMTELRDMREERVLTGRQMIRLDDKVIEHEKRLRVLEKESGLCGR